MRAYTLRCGFPHSDIHGSTGARPSPQLFAACHVLHRLLAPRHPPDALAFLAHQQRQPQNHPMKPAASRGPRPCAHRAHEERTDAAGAAGGDSSDYHKGPSLRGTARIPMPDDVPAHKDGKTKRRAKTSTCRCPPRTTHGGSLPHARCGHLITTSRCPNSKGPPPSLRKAPPLREDGHAWWAWADSNGRPHAYQACALTS